MKITQFSNVILKNGAEADIIEILDDTHFIAAVGSSPAEWHDEDITLEDIKEVTYLAPE